MGYLKGDEGSFRGFGSILDMLNNPLTVQDACLISTESPGCQQIFSEVERRFNAEYSLAGQKVRDIASRVPVIGESLPGIKNPQAALMQARLFASQFSKDDVEQAAYNIFYNQARGGVEMLASYAQAVPVFGTLAEIGRTTGAAVGGMSKWIDRVEKKGVDAAGIQDAANVANRTLVGISRVAQAFGTSSEGVMSEITSYLTLAVGCTAAIAAGAATGPWGAAAGAVGCFGMALAQLFKKAPPEPFGMNAVFTPTPLWGQLAARDAQRLAMLLRYVYGVRSTEQLIKGYTTIVGRDIRTGHKNDGLCLELGCYPKEGSNTPFPGFNWEMIVQMSRVIHGDMENLDCDGSAGSGIAGGSAAKTACPFLPDWSWCAGPQSEFDDKGCPKPRGLDVSAMVRSSERVLHRGALNTARKRASVTVLEWLNFFGAMCAASPREEVANEKEGTTTLAELLSGSTMPVRFKNAKAPGGRPYSENRWTNAGDWFRGYMSETASLQTREQQLAAGAIRLSAAFSYLVLQYHRGKNVFADADGSSNYIWQMTVGKDMIASLPDLPGDASSQLRLPVDPRATVNGLPSIAVLAGEITRRRRRLEEIEDRARKQGKLAGGDAANADAAKVVSVAGEFQKRLLEQQYMSSSTIAMRSVVDNPIAAAVESGRLKLELTTPEQREAAAAKARAAANAALAAEAEKELASTKGGGAAPILLAGAAALLAMKFLK
jgi:hypothetical protein